MNKRTVVKKYSSIEEATKDLDAVLKEDLKQD